MRCEAEERGTGAEVGQMEPKQKDWKGFVSGKTSDGIILLTKFSQWIRNLIDINFVIILTLFCVISSRLGVFTAEFISFNGGAHKTPFLPRDKICRLKIIPPGWISLGGFSPHTFEKPTELKSSSLEFNKAGLGGEDVAGENTVKGGEVGKHANHNPKTKGSTCPSSYSSSFPSD